MITLKVEKKVYYSVLSIQEVFCNLIIEQLISILFITIAFLKC